MALTLTYLGAVSNGYTLTVAAAVAVGERIFVATPAFPRETVYGKGVGNHIADAASNSYTLDGFNLAFALLGYSQVTTPLVIGDVVTLNHGGSLSFAENNGFLNPATGAVPGIPCGIAFKVTGHDPAVTWVKDLFDQDSTFTVYKAATDKVEGTVDSSGGSNPGATFYLTATPPSGTPEQLTLLLVSQNYSTEVGFTPTSAPSAITTPSGFTPLGSATTVGNRNLGIDFQIRIDLYYRIRNGGTNGPLVLPSKTYTGLGSHSLCHIYYGWNTYDLKVLPEPSDAIDTSLARAYHGKLCLAYVDSAGAVKVNRYNDAVPPTVAATVTLETSGATGVSLQARCSGEFDLMYAHSNTIKRRISTDAGRSFDVASTVATGYQDVCHLVDEARGLSLALVWLQASNAWYVSVGTLDSGGTTWTYTAPASIVSSANRGGQLLRRGDGTYEFSYTTVAGVATIVRCSSISKAGSGSWA